MVKIIDCFIFYNEIDMLEYRLKEIDSVVDYYVLVECKKTFSNNDKDFFFENNKKKFSKFLDKIIYIKVENNIPQSSNAWDREWYQRNCIDDGIKKLNLNKDDIIIISDIDEIPDINTLLNIKNNNKLEGIYSLEQDIYYYNLYCKGLNSKWYFPKILNYGSYNNNPQSIRANNTNIPIIKNGGWHFSYFGDIEFIKNKIKNFSHQEYNNDQILNDDRILTQIKNCNDLFGRDNKNTHNFTYVDIKNNNYLPNNYKDLLYKKNLTMITSVIKTISDPLIWCPRSVFTHDERYNQTLYTIETLKKYSPNTYIVLIEASEIPKEWEDEIIKRVDYYHNISKTDYKKAIDSKSKAYGEASLLLSYLKSEHFLFNRHRFNTLSKLSGRYYLEPNFINYNDIMINSNNKNKIIVQVRENFTQILTMWLCMQMIEVNDFITALEKSFNNVNFINGKQQIEEYLYTDWIKNKDYINVPYIGVSGRGATHGGLSTL